MARPMKEGLDYFPMDVDIFENMKVRRLMRKYKITGFSIYVKILCDIYRNSYYLEFTDDYLLDLADEFEQSNIGVARMVSYMVKIGLFDEEMWKIHILTEEFIQERYFAAKARYYRGKQKKLLYIINPISVTKYGVLSDGMPQRKDKQNIKQNIKQNNKDKITTTPTTPKHGTENLEFQNFSDTENDQPATLIQEGIFDENPEEKEEEESCAKEEEENSGKEEESFFQKAQKFQMVLQQDEEWLYSVSVCSGKEKRILEFLPGALKLFEMHIVTIGETDSVLTINDYKRRFLSWWRCLNFDSAADILKRSQKKENNSANYQKTNRGPQKISRVEEAYNASKEAAKIAKQLLKSQSVY